MLKKPDPIPYYINGAGRVGYPWVTGLLLSLLKRLLLATTLLPNDKYINIDNSLNKRLVIINNLRVLDINYKLF